MPINLPKMRCSCWLSCQRWLLRRWYLFVYPFSCKSMQNAINEERYKQTTLFESLTSLSISSRAHHCLSCAALDVCLTFCSNYVRFKSIYWNLWIKFYVKWNVCLASAARLLSSITLISTIFSFFGVRLYNGKICFFLYKFWHCFD